MEEQKVQNNRVKEMWNAVKSFIRSVTESQKERNKWGVA